MTREEEIIEAATNYGYSVAGGSPIRPSISEAYKNGAKYADASLIEKAYEWLEKELFNKYDNNDISDIEPECVMSSSYNNKYNLLRAFRIAMES